MPQTLRRRALRRAGFALSLALLAAAAAASVWSVRQTSEGYRWVAHTHRVISVLHHYRGSVSAIDAAARGYRLAPMRSLRRDFEDDLPAVGRTADQLAALVVDNPAQEQRARALQRLTAMRLGLARQTMQGRGALGPVLAASAAQSDEIDALLARMLAEEERLLARRIDQSAQFEGRLLAFTVSGLGLAATVLLVLMASLKREILRSRALEAKALDGSRQLEQSLFELGRVSDQRAALGRLASLLQSCQDVDEALRVTSLVVGELLPNAGGRCYLLRASQDLAETAMTFGLPPVGSATLLHPSQCWALRRGQPYLVDKLGSGVACAHVEHADGATDAWTLCTPLLAQGIPLGLLFVAGEPDADRHHAKALIDSVAEQLGLSLVNLQLREKLRMQSLRDPLTGLFNRRYLDESLPREVSRCLRRDLPLAVLMLDVDHFKSFNDTHGHAAGDALLTEIAQALLANTRNEDLVCRYGGEEFTIVLVEAAREDALRRAEQIRETVAAITVQHLRQTLGPRSVSIGMAILGEHGQSPATLLQQADAALYRAKAEGRDRVACA